MYTRLDTTNISVVSRLSTTKYKSHGEFQLPINKVIKYMRWVLQRLSKSIYLHMKFITYY